MQSALNFAPVLSSCFTANAGSKSSVASRFSPIRATARVAYEMSTVDYSSSVSVFPAEACETIGGDACVANIYPEVKLKSDNRRIRANHEPVERDYIDYTAYQKTVLLGEACDVLGGEFCQRPYQRGIY